MSVRLAVVQHGDYAEAFRLISAGEREPYFGMKYSVEALEKFLGDLEFLLVTLDAPGYRLPHRKGTLVGVRRPAIRKVGRLLHPWLVFREVRAFRPTHLLLRTGGELALPLLRYAVKHQVNTMVLHAGYMSDSSPREAALNRELAGLMNDPYVFLVGNHRVPAAESMVSCGVLREKVFAYDWPGQASPDQYPAKAAPPPGVCRVAYAGMMVPSKGVGDLLESVIALNESGFVTRLTACGSGDGLDGFRRRAEAKLGPLAEFPGRVPNARVMEVMAAADLVCVPSHRDASEGFPFTATEALACRTPLIASDHPSLTHLLRDGEGVRFFRSGDVNSLAGVIREVMTDPASYEKLSESTATAHQRIVCRTLFHELLDRWRASW
jgi:glycosyltransferase involved in cell wall biosynthesis